MGDHEDDTHRACGCHHEHVSGGVTRRQTLDMLAAGGLAALMGSLTAGLARPAYAQDDDVVRIGYLPITDATALLVAHGMGYFEDEGLTAERPTLIRGWSPLVEGFAANKFNVVHLLKPIPVWMRYNNNFPVKLMAWAHTNGSALVVGGHTGIQDFSQLGGKQVAVPFWYSMHNIVLQYALKKSGVTPVIRSATDPLADNECNLQILPPPEMPAALASRKIDAYIVAEPFNAMGEMKAGGRVLRFTGDIWKNHPCCVICMHEAATTEKPEWTQKVMNALVRAQIYASQNRAEAALLMSKDGEGYLPMPAPIVERAMTHYAEDPAYIDSGAIKHADWDINRIDFNGYPYPSATRLIVDAMNDTLVGGDTTFLANLDPEFVSNDLVNYEYVKAALNAHPEWLNDPSVNKADPFVREEVLQL